MPKLNQASPQDNGGQPTLTAHLQRAIDNYLKQSLLRSIATLARETQVPYSTLRRVMHGEAVPDLATVICVLNVVCNQHQAQQFLAQHFPNTFNACNSSFLQAESPPQDLINQLDSEFSLEILQTIAQTEECSKEHIAKSFGEYGVRKIDDYIRAGYVKEDASGCLQFLGLATASNPSVCLKNIRVVSKTFNRDNLGTDAAVMATIYESTDLDGLKQIKQFGIDYHQKVRTIVTNHPGDVPVFVAWMHNVSDIDDIHRYAIHSSGTDS